MKTLLIFATSTGSTIDVTHCIASEFSQKDKEITVINALNVKPEEINDYDLIILGSSTWGEGELPEAFTRLVEKLSSHKFTDKKFAVFGLGDATYTYFCGAADHLENFVKQVEGKLIVPTLKIDNFYFNEKQEIPKIQKWAKEVIKNLESVNTTTP